MNVMTAILPTSRGRFSPNDSESATMFRPLRRHICVFHEVIVWPKFHIRNRMHRMQDRTKSKSKLYRTISRVYSNEVRCPANPCFVVRMTTPICNTNVTYTLCMSYIPYLYLVPNGSYENTPLVYSK